MHRRWCGYLFPFVEAMSQDDSVVTANPDVASTVARNGVKMSGDRRPDRYPPEGIPLPDRAEFTNSPDKPFTSSCRSKYCSISRTRRFAPYTIRKSNDSSTVAEYPHGSIGRHGHRGCTDIDGNLNRVPVDPIEFPESTFLDADIVRQHPSGICSSKLYRYDISVNADVLTLPCASIPTENEPVTTSCPTVGTRDHCECVEPFETGGYGRVTPFGGVNCLRDHHKNEEE